MPAPPSPSHDAYAALRVPAFRRFVACVMAMTVGVQIQGVVVGWQVYEITHDPLSLGLIGLAEALPFITAALWAGHVADHHDRRRISLIALAVLIGCSLALLGTTLAAPQLGGWRLACIYGVIVLSGLARSFLQPARTALSAQLVARELYANAVAWRSSTWQLAAVVGPAVGGMLYGFGSATLAYSVDAVLIVLAFGLMLSVDAPPMPVMAETLPIAESLRSGLRFVFGEPVILGALTLDLFSVLFGGATALLPIFASDILKVGPQGLGLLRAAPAVGAVAMSLALAHRAPMARAGRALFIAVALFGVLMIAFGLSRSFALSLVLLALSGMVDNVSVVIRSTLLQTRTPEHLLGRVSAVNAIFIGSSNEIGSFESGLTARLFGTVRSVVLGGLATLAVVGVTAWRVPELRRFGRLA